MDNQLKKGLSVWRRVRSCHNWRRGEHMDGGPEIDIEFRVLPGQLFQGHTHVVTSRAEVPQLYQEVVDDASMHPDATLMFLTDFGAEEGGLQVRIGLASSSLIGIAGLEAVELKEEQALVATHRGPYSSIRDTYMEMYAVMRRRGLVPQTRAREVVHHLDPGDPEATVIEVQWPLHDWTGLLAGGVEEVLGPEAREHVMQGVDSLTPETSREDRLEWVKGALARLEGIADEEQMYWSISRCADCYPAWRVRNLRQVFLDTGSVDAVMDAMKGDIEWYSTPRREGNLIYHTKVPYDRAAWEAATDREGRRRAYCHCPLIQKDPGDVTPTYCYCGTGWVRQLRPIRVEVLKSLPAGDEECQFLIHLPEDVVGGGD